MENGRLRIFSRPKLSPSNSATAFQIGKSIKDHVLTHRHNRYYLIIDLKDFFPTIIKYKVKTIFSTIGYTDEVSNILSNLCCCNGKLPQGGVTSPSLSNLIGSKLDRRLQGYTSKRAITYTRYADDLCFSNNDPIILRKSIKTISLIIKNEKFIINKNKCRFVGPGQNISVTGLVKNNDTPKFSIGKQKERRMRAIAHSLYVKKIADSKYSNEESINGWLAHLKYIDNKKYLKFITYIDNLKLKSKNNDP